MTEDENAAVMTYHEFADWPNAVDQSGKPGTWVRGWLWIPADEEVK